MKAITTQRTAIIIFLVVVLGGFCYNFLISYLDKRAYDQSVALVAAQEATAPRTRTITQDGITQYEKCERGFCWSAADEESLKHAMRRNTGGSSGGFPIIDTASLRELNSQNTNGSVD